MRRIAVLLVAFVLLVVPAVFAQNHGEIGMFGQYFRNSAMDTNFGGPGGEIVDKRLHTTFSSKLT